MAAKGPGEEISIRGIAGPYVVIGSNFAPGTTAADIESAMVPSGGEMQSCRIISSSPTVMAEMVFAEKQNAESVIYTFNNKKVWNNGQILSSFELIPGIQADGRILYVYMKVGGPTPSTISAPLRKTPNDPRAPRVDLTRDPAPSYDAQREQSDRNRRRADPEFQDGSYGFDVREDVMDVDMDAARSDPPVSEVPQSDASRSDATRIDPPRSDRRDDRRDDHRDARGDDRRDDRRDAHYDSPNNYGRGRPYNDRDRDHGRPRNDQRLYSDNLYSRPRGGRGFR